MTPSSHVRQFLKKVPPLVKRLRRAAPWIASIAGVSGLALLLWFLLGTLPQRNLPPKLTPKERTDLVNANRDNVLKVIQTIAGLGFFATAYLAWRNSQLAEDKNVTDRFSKAVEMLADERLEMRLGGIYSLERIARDSKEDHPVVMEVLTAFIRNRAGITEQRQQGSFISSFVSQGNSQESAVKPNQDIQSALTVIGRRNANNEQQRL
ncbi:MAG: hypothetical protein AAFW84_35640, partial [Cyanobacteria bacterium J06635_15]